MNDSDSKSGSASAWGEASESTRLRFVIAVIVLASVAELISAYFRLGWAAASVTTFLLCALILLFIFRHRDLLFAHLALFGLVFGFAELPSDHLAVAKAMILVYPQEGPFIWSSPLYMPFSYIIVMVQLGYLSYWITRRWNLLTATLAITMLGAVMVPGYEYFAKLANFWHYQNCPMLFGAVPYFTIVTEALLALVLPALIAVMAKSRRWAVTIGLGLAEGVWVYLCAWVGLQWLV